jgi:Predicted hydrolases of HD superfamily
VDDLQARIDFFLEVDKMKNIVRQTYIADGSRKENDAEHSWHMALMCVVFSDYANEKIDVLKAVKMALIHDLVEVDAGDTYAFDDEHNKTKEIREQKAADRIFGILPKDVEREYRQIWDEFEAEQTPEAKFVNALDKVQPLLLNDKTGGKSWLEHGIKASQVYQRNERTAAGSKEIWEYAKKIIESNVEKKNLLNE